MDDKLQFAASSESGVHAAGNDMVPGDAPEDGDNGPTRLPKFKIVGLLAHLKNYNHENQIRWKKMLKQFAEPILKDVALELKLNVLGTKKSGYVEALTTYAVGAYMLGTNK